MKLTIQSHFGEKAQRTTIEISEECTVGELRTNYFRNRKVAAQFGSNVSTSDLVFYDENGREVDKALTLRECGIAEGDTIYLRMPDAKETSTSQSKTNSKGKSLPSTGKALVALALLLAIACLAVLIAVPYEQETQPRETLTGSEALEYAILMDAGSSHTNLFVYAWNSSALQSGTGQVFQVNSTCTNPNASGITTFPDPSVAADSLRYCLDYSKEVVPVSKYSSTRVYLGATAGLRLLREKNMSAAQELIRAVRRTIHTYPFAFQDTWARMLDGKEEGVFGWVTVNYLMGPIGIALENDETSGALDLGGASTQITFIPENPNMPDGYSYPLSLYGKSYTPYTYSYLCFGLNEARRYFTALLVEEANYTEIVDNPCAFRGDSYNVTGDYLWAAPCSHGPEAVAAWGRTVDAPHPSLLSPQYCPDGSLCAADDHRFLIRGTGNAVECQAFIRRLFPKPQCNFPSCSFNGVFQPPPTGSFSAFAGYYHTANILNLTGEVQVGSLRQASSILCNMTYDEVAQVPGVDLRFIHNYCFDGKYSSELLSYGLLFDDNYYINIQRDVNGTSVGWALGFMTNATNIIPPLQGPKKTFLKETEFTGIIVAVAFVFVLSLLASIYFCRWRRSDYQPLASAESKYGAV